MTAHPLLLVGFMAILISCKGQTASQAEHKVISDPQASIAQADTVAKLDNTIFILFQAGNNDYWFGSNGQGVYRYDGKTILHFSSKDGLVNDPIRGIQEDKLGNIFITTMGGISKFDGQQFTTLPVIESNEWRLDSNDLWFSALG